MLLNKIQSAELLNKFIEDELIYLTDYSIKTTIPKDDSWGVYIKGVDLKLNNSFCGVDF